MIALIIKSSKTKKIFWLSASLVKIKAMKCEICKAYEATVHVTQISNGKIRKLNVCVNCAAKSGLLGIEALNDQRGEAGYSQMDSTRADVLHCTECGFTLEQFEKVGRLGCPACYKHLKPAVIASMLELDSFHAHNGKVPRRQLQQKSMREAIEEKQKQLEGVVRKEDFSSAAQLRDEIRQLKLQYNQLLNKPFYPL